MDAFVTKLERLAELAKERSSPGPLDVNSVMEKIRGLEREDDSRVLCLPLGSYFAGGLAAAAAVAIGISVFAVMAWTEMSSPFAAFDSLLNVMDVL